jgi:hypothetical protein
MTSATQRDQLRQNVRSVLYEDGHLSIDSHYSASNSRRDQARDPYHHPSDRHRPSDRPY